MCFIWNSTGRYNTASGVDALYSNTTGNYNTAIGDGALGGNTTGSENIAVGDTAGNILTTGSNNIDIGNQGVAGESNTIRIGTTSTQTAAYMAGIWGGNPGGGLSPVYVNASGQLGAQASSRRFKKDIADMDTASEALLSLKPVTFHYKSDTEGTPQFGLIAEEVAKVCPDLVLHDKNGEIYTVCYDAVNAMLLNEFLKEHRQVRQQKPPSLSNGKAWKPWLHNSKSRQRKSRRWALSSPQRVRPLADLKPSKFAAGRIRRGGHGAASSQ